MNFLKNLLAAQQSEAAKIKASQDYGRLDRLLKNEDVRWLLETHLQPIATKERTASQTLTLGKDKCWEHLHRLEVARRLAEALATEHARLEKKLRVIP